MQRRPPAVPAVLATVAVLGAERLRDLRRSAGPSAAEPARRPATSEVDDRGRRRTGTVDELAADALADLEDYWSETFPEVFGAEFVPLAGRLLQRRPGRRRPGGVPATAWAAAPSRWRPRTTPSTAVAPVRPTPTRSPTTGRSSAELAEGYGEFIPALVMAHEFGHAVQARVGAPGPSIATETQADCLAGSWTRWVAEGNADRTPASGSRSSTSCSAATCCSATRWARAPRRSRRTAPTSTACRPSRRASTAGRRPAATTSGPTGSSPRAGSRPTRTSATRATPPYGELIGLVELSLPEFWDRAFTRGLPGDLHRARARGLRRHGAGLRRGATATSSTAPTADLVGFDERDLTREVIRRTSATSPSPRRCPSPTRSPPATSWGCRSTTRTPSGRRSASPAGTPRRSTTGASPASRSHPGTSTRACSSCSTYGDDPDVLGTADLTGFQLVDLFRGGFVEGASAPATSSDR